MKYVGAQKCSLFTTILCIAGEYSSGKKRINHPFLAFKCFIWYTIFVGEFISIFRIELEYA